MILKEIWDAKKRIFLVLLIILGCNVFLQADNDEYQENILDLSREERDWKRENSEITIAIDDRNPPLNYRIGTDQFMGLTVDYLKLIEAKSGLKIHIWGGSWNDALTGALNHEFDGVANASAQEERKPFLNFTESYFTTPIAFATRKGMEKMDDITGFNGRSIAAIRGSSRVGLLEKACPDSLVIEVGSPEEGINQLSENKVDVFVDDLPVIQHLIDTLFLINLKISLLYYSEESISRIGLRNDTPFLLSIMNKAIAAISPEEHREILNKWFHQSETIPEQYSFSLTEEEKAWLQNNKTFSIGIDQSWSPIEFKDSNGEYRGIAVDYLRELEILLDINFDIVDAPWKDILEMGRNGEIDLFSSMTETEERKQYYLFTEEYLKLPIVVFSRSQMSIISDLAELKDHNVVVVANYAAKDLMNKEYPAIDLVEVLTISEALEGIESEKYDYYIGGLLTTGDYIRRLGYTNLRVVGDSPFTYSNRIAVRKDLAPLIPILNKALKSIPGSKQNEIYQKWINVRYEQVADYKLIIQIGSLLVLALITVLLWNYNLKRVVKKRTQEIWESGAALKESEDNLRMIYESNPAGLFRVDSRRNLITCNPAFREIFGIPENMNLSQIKMDEFFQNPLDMDQIESRLMEKKDQLKREIQFKDIKGNPFWGEILLNLIINEEYEKIIINGIITEISQRKKMELEILKENHFIDSLLDNLPGMFYLCDSNGYLKRWNKMHEEFTGFSAEELKDKNLLDYFPDSEQKKKILSFFSNILSENTAEIEIEGLTKKDGSTIPLLFKAGKITIDKEEYILGFGLDMRENKRLEKQLLHSQKMEAIGTLAGGISHDFNNVLGAIIGFTELSLLELEDNETISSYLDQILKASLRAKDLVKQILLFSRQGNSEMKPTHLVPIIREVTNLMKATLPVSIEIIAEYSTTEDLILCDATQIHQVFMNLMTNAAAAIENGKGKILITVERVREENNSSRELKILVKDTGCGIPPEVVERIFDPFFTTKSKEKGTGLGLSVVHGIVEKHGGEIKVYSEMGKGSTFLINLPLLKKQNQESSLHQGIIPRGIGRILYVDDEINLCQIMDNLLKDLGYSPVIFNDSREALEHLRQNSRDYDLALLDKTMPHLSGLDLTKELKELNPSLPVVISTGYSDSELNRQVQELGIREILQKPVSKWELAVTLNRIISKGD